MQLYKSPLLKGGGTWKISYCFFVPMFSLGNAKTKTKILKCIEVHSKISCQNMLTIAFSSVLCYCVTS